jgi:hypothetical protein
MYSPGLLHDSPEPPCIIGPGALSIVQECIVIVQVYVLICHKCSWVTLQVPGTLTSYSRPIFCIVPGLLEMVLGHLTYLVQVFYL